jgi:copper chaperone
MRTVRIKGMSCQHCVKAVTKALSEIEGVSGVQVDLASGEASFEESQPVSPEVLAEKVKKAGFELG